MASLLIDLALVLAAGSIGFGVGAVWMLRRRAPVVRATKGIWPYVADRRVCVAVGRRFVSRRMRSVRALARSRS